MLEGVLRVNAETALVPFLFAARGRCRSSTTAAHGRALEPSRRAPGSFLAAVNGVAEHFGNGFSATQKMDLESVRLLLRAGFGVNSSDV
jgi:hypothetical protein